MTPREQLLEMLRYMRPGRSREEERFLNRFLLPLPGAWMDKFGNVIVRVGDAPILFSSHTDTVHDRPGKQVVTVTDDGFAFVKNSSCLGADCTTGVWLMVQMIEAGVPGLYVFHRDEESGGRGSTYIAENTPELLSGIQAAIALDRYGTASIITHQFMCRGCSAEFAASLDEVLGGGFKPDDGGTFTHTANYFELVPECTNLSVGYYKQHTRAEYQDLDFALALRDLLIAADWSKLVIKRDPTARDDDRWWEKYGTFEPRTSAVDPAYDLWDDEHALPEGARRHLSGRDHLRELVLDHPDVVVDLLDQCGVTADEILAVVYGRDRRAA